MSDLPSSGHTSLQNQKKKYCFGVKLDNFTTSCFQIAKEESKSLSKVKCFTSEGSDLQMLSRVHLLMDIRNSLSVLTQWAAAVNGLMSCLTLSHTCGCNTPTHHSHTHIFPTPLYLVETAVNYTNPFGKWALSESRCWMYALG